MTERNRLDVCGAPRTLYLIKRGPRPEFHRAPYHRVIICTRKHTAKWEAGWTGDCACVWEKDADPSSGWLLVKWFGLDIDYGHIVRGSDLFRGGRTGIHHDRAKEPWSLLKRAKWWSDHRIPGWLIDAGVKPPRDMFSRKTIMNDYGDCLLSESTRHRLEDRREAALEKADVIWEL